LYNLDYKLHLPPILEIIEPTDILSALVLNSPHSGSNYPEIFLNQSILTQEQLRRGEDTDVDKLFHAALPHGACFMKALFPRSFIDANREAYELDQNMFDGKLPSFANIHSVRVAGGLGTIPRVIGEKTVIYNKKLNLKTAFENIDLYYKPYHQALQLLLQRVKNKFGMFVLLDCHSMPSCISGKDNVTRKDIILGDRFGKSCSPILIEQFECEAKKLGYEVTRNLPYAGGYITEHYGSPKTNGHALQIEINRALYMNEKTLRLTDNFYSLQADLKKIIATLSSLKATDLAPFSNAAE
jgi:N-formylglutamate amidohydrolase